MTTEDLEFIQRKIDYRFKNVDLLQQAFVRRSFAKEDGGNDNEILEFIGDKALDIVIVKYLIDKHGRIERDQEWDEFVCEYDEGRLTILKSQLVQKKTLAHRIDMLEFADFLIMGKGDTSQHIERRTSVKEDLFEAIIGAVTLDSNWDFVAIENVVENMLQPDAELLDEDIPDNYIGKLQEWTVKRQGSLPQYNVIPYDITIRDEYADQFVFGYTVVSREQSGNRTIDTTDRMCILYVPGLSKRFVGFGDSVKATRISAARAAYDYLTEYKLLNTVRDEIGEPTLADAINQLEILARKGYFSLPKYYFREKKADNGNSIWRCECRIAEVSRRRSASSSSKRISKKHAALNMLKYVLKEIEDGNTFTETKPKRKK